MYAKKVTIIYREKEKKANGLFNNLNCMLCNVNGLNLLIVDIQHVAHLIKNLNVDAHHAFSLDMRHCRIVKPAAIANPVIRILQGRHITPGGGKILQEKCNGTGVPGHYTGSQNFVRVHVCSGEGVLQDNLIWSRLLHSLIIATYF